MVGYIIYKVYRNKEYYLCEDYSFTNDLFDDDIKYFDNEDDARGFINNYDSSDSLEVKLFEFELF